MKQKLLLWLFSLLSATGVHAQVAYCMVTDTDGNGSKETLTFKYDNNMPASDAWTFNQYWQLSLDQDVKDAITHAVFDTSFSNARPTSCTSWFSGMQNLEKIDNLGSLNTSEVTSMSSMFQGCEKLQSLDLSGFDTSKTTEMGLMFYGCSSLKTLDLSNFDIQKCNYFYSVFKNCSSLKSVNISTLDLKSSTLTSLFSGCEALEFVDMSHVKLSYNPNTSYYYNDYPFSGCTNLLCIDMSEATTTGGTAKRNSGLFCQVPKNTIIYLPSGWTTSESNIVIDGVCNQLYISDEGTGDWGGSGHKYLMPHDIQATHFTYGRGIAKNTYAVVCLPADYNVSKDKHMKIYKYVGKEGNNLKFKSTLYGTLTANQPYLIKPAGEYDIQIDCDADDYTITANVSGTTFKGSTMGCCAGDATGLVTLQEDGTWAAIANDEMLPAFRTYFDASILGGSASLGTGIQNMAYSELIYDESFFRTLHFKYGDPVLYAKSSEDICPQWWDVSDTGTTEPEWCNYLGSVDGKVTFDPSFANARPKSCYSWFASTEWNSRVGQINGLEYLNTSEVTNMDYMFGNCSGVYLDLSHFDFQKVTSCVSMFSKTSYVSSSFNCINLSTAQNLTGVTFNRSDANGMFYNLESSTIVYLPAGNTVASNQKNAVINGESNYIEIYDGYRNCYLPMPINATTFYYHRRIDKNTLISVCLPFSFELPEGVRAFTYDSKTESEYVFHEISGSTLAANTPYLLWTEEDDKKIVYEAPLSFIPFTTSEANYLGTTIGMVSDDYAYLEAGNNGKREWLVNDYVDFFPAFRSYFTKSYQGEATSMGTHLVSLGNCAYAELVAIDEYNPYYTHDIVLKYGKKVPDNYTSWSAEDTGTEEPGWNNPGNYVSWRMIKTDASFADARPKSCYHWFSYMSKDYIDITYLNTSEVTNMNGMFSGFDFGESGMDLSWLNTANVTDMSEMFYNCSSLTNLDLSGWTATKLTNMSSMFYGCSNLTSVALFDTPNVTDMSNLFRNCTSLTSFTIPNTSSVTTMGGMFCGCKGFTSIDLSSLQTTNLTDMSSMFSGCTNLTNVEFFDVSNVTSMYGMFSGCTSLTSIDLRSLQTMNLTEMGYMFGGCTNLTNVKFFDVSNVTDMGYLFKGCTNLINIDLSELSTMKLTNMRYMFSGCTNLTNVKFFDVSNVTTMYYMFEDCTSLTNIDLSGLTATNLTDMSYMFSGCTGLTDVKFFNAPKVSDIRYLFKGCTNLKNVNLVDLGTEKISSMSNVFENCSSLTTIDFGNMDLSKAHYPYSVFKNCSSLRYIDMSNTTLDLTGSYRNVSRTSNTFNGTPTTTLVYLPTTGCAVKEGEQNFIVNGACDNLVIDETTTNYLVPHAINASGFSYNRELNANTLYSLCLPFNYELPEGVKAYEFTNQDGNELVFTCISEGTLVANTPYLVKTAEESSLTITYDQGCNINATDEGTTFIGTTKGYHKGENNTAAILQSGGVWKKAGQKIVPAFRAYIDITSLSGSAPQFVSRLSGDITAIRLVNSNGEAEKIYDLKGQYVGDILEQLPNGIYIKNGKKIIKK